MPEKTPPRLTVVSQEGCRYVVVPCEWAGALRDYLQRKGYFVPPPQAVSTGLSSLALSRKADLKAVQAHLDGWAGCA